jgi:hypothetical protein
MSRAAARIVLGAALLLLLAGFLWWWLGGREGRAAREAREAAAAGAERVALPVDLYFPAGDGGLGVERREIQTTRAPKDQVRHVVEALLAGPQANGLVRPLPREVAVGGVVLAGNVAYVDLRWADHEDPPPGGSMAEMQTVYSLVNSIALNVPQASQVVLLWNGAQRLSFSGHLDTSQPLAPDRSLLAR